MRHSGCRLPALVTGPARGCPAPGAGSARAVPTPPLPSAEPPPPGGSGTGGSGPGKLCWELPRTGPDEARPSQPRCGPRAVREPRGGSLCRNKRKILTAHAAGEGLPEVGQELVNLGKGLGVRRVVVEHQAARGHVESSGIHRVHRRRSLAAGCAVRRRSARAAGAGGPGAGAGRVSPWSGATWSRAAAAAAARRPRRPCRRGPRRLLLRLPRGRPRSERRLGPGGSGATAGPCGPYPPRRGAPAAVGASLSGGPAWRRPQAGSANGRGAAAGPR